MIGCGLKVQVISSRQININFVVAYFHGSPKPHLQAATSSGGQLTSLMPATTAAHVTNGAGAEVTASAASAASGEVTGELQATLPHPG